MSAIRFEETNIQRKVEILKKKRKKKEDKMLRFYTPWKIMNKNLVNRSPLNCVDI